MKELRPIHEIFRNLFFLKKYVGNGKIMLYQSGHIEFHKKGYLLKKNCNFRCTAYTDNKAINILLARRRVPKYILLEEENIVDLYYRETYNYITAVIYFSRNGYLYENRIRKYLDVHDRTKLINSNFKNFFYHGMRYNYDGACIIYTKEV